MIFNSIEFAVFLPIVFLLYWFVFSGKKERNWKGESNLKNGDGGKAEPAKRARLQNLLLLVSSYVFYAFLDWRFLGLIAFTTLTTYVSGLLIGKYRFQPASLSLSLKNRDSQVANLSRETSQGSLRPSQTSTENPIGGGVKIRTGHLKPAGKRILKQMR